MTVSLFILFIQTCYFLLFFIREDTTAKKPLKKKKKEDQPEPEVTSSRDKFFHVSSSLQDAFAASKTSKRATSEREAPAEDEQTFSLRKLFGADEEKTAPSEAPPLFFLTTSFYMTLHLLLCFDQLQLLQRAATSQV